MATVAQDSKFSARNCKDKAPAPRVRALQRGGTSGIIRLFGMNKIGLLLLPVFAFVAQPLSSFAQENDPSEVFLKAYMTAQQGEKLERENQLKPALSKFRFAGSMIEELKKTNGDWQPAIVEYRGRKIGEAILRVQSKIATQKDLAETAEPIAAETEVPAQPSGAPSEPSVEIGAQPRPSPAVDVQAAIQDATKGLRARVDALQAELKKSQKEISTAQKEKSEISGRLQETNVELEQAKAALAKTSKSEKEVRDQLAAAQESLQVIQSSGAGDQKAALALQGEITQ
jgi:DNA repair exonuclease SbcCD ATPase subunit